MSRFMPLRHSFTATLPAQPGLEAAWAPNAMRHFGYPRYFSLNQG